MDTTDHQPVFIEMGSDDEKFEASDYNSNHSQSSEDSFDSLMRDYGDLGTTPPRTRILRRERSSRESIKQKSRPRSRHRKTSHEKIITRVISHGKRYLNNQLHYLLNGDIETEGSIDKRRSSKKHVTRQRDFDRFTKLDSDLKVIKTGDFNNTLRTMKVESSNRFLSLSCKLVKTAINWRTAIPEGTKNRSDFHEYFSSIVKSGYCDKEKCSKRQLSEEESLWQTELKDMIWLELQAWRADRTPTQQDMYLCEARSKIPQILDDILNYKFAVKAGVDDSVSTTSYDSGINLSCNSDCSSCSGCLEFFCPLCLENCNRALEQVKSLMHRLEAAESLYPSAKAFGNQFAVYKSNEFVGKMNAMFIWFNIMQQLRLKILILGKHLVSFAQEHADRSNNGSSPEDTFEWQFSNLCETPHQPLHSLGRYFRYKNSSDRRMYRKFIEDVLKTRGLRKAVFFLEYLHLEVLKNGRMALSKVEDNKNEEIDSADEELLRFGYWSEEYQSMGLPSFRPAFLFLSRIPLEVLHEFCIMRLETKLDKPSSLSIRQLIKELKDGIRLSVIHKQRYVDHCEIVLAGESEEVRQMMYLDYVSLFDASVYSVLDLYLNYIVQWVTLTEQEKIQKNILEEEWKFVTSYAPHITEGECRCGVVFCTIAKTMLVNTSNSIRNKLDLTNEELSGSFFSRQTLLAQCRLLQTACIETREKTFRTLSLTKTLIKHLESMTKALACKKVAGPLVTMKEGLVEVWKILKERVTAVEISLSSVLKDDNSIALLSSCREVMHRMYKFAFEYVKDVIKFTGDRHWLALETIEFARQWINFVTSFCEKGRGVRPRWASYGVDFLMHVTDPAFTSFLAEKEFETFKKDVETCIVHIMGAPSTAIPSSPNTIFSSMPRSSSPSPSISRGSSVSTPDSGITLDPDVLENFFHAAGVGIVTSKMSRIRSSIKQLDARLERRRKQAELIGTVVISPENQLERNIKARTVNFPWQRGIKIGHGRFGKAYTAVNTQTGEVMAMKEILLQPNDLRTIRKVGLEFKMFEGIQHEYLVKYYGAEVHREELLIFMELCTGGTLESMIGSIENGLPEGLVRRYTLQLVTAICVLHHHSIVHRDIKPANIFLTDEGYRIKLGDFGCAVKIKANSTAPGELKGFVGTQAYMAPEVFMQSTSYGHGRSVDIWSLGCVVIEMASGKRPWSDLDSNYQIMFKVGMGKTPEIPENLSEEGQMFVESCIQYNPKNRPSSLQLKQHPFLKVDSDDETLSLFNMPSTLENYLKLGIKR